MMMMIRVIAASLGDDVEVSRAKIKKLGDDVEVSRAKIKKLVFIQQYEKNRKEEMSTGHWA
ncbi:hypothetical protein Hanom_Chr14g01292591 [Helianthus anomalus]